MRGRHGTTSYDGARAVRLAWLVSFVATLLLVAILAMAKSAQAAAPSDPFAPGAFAASLADEEECGDGECEEEGFEDEECEEDEAGCEEGEGVEAPAECLLSRAEATVFASTGRDQVRLVVRYETEAPTPVTVEYGLHGSRGSLYLGAEKKPAASGGVVRQTKDLSEAQMAKVVAAKDFTVRLRVPAAPHFCQRYFDRHLTVRRAGPSGLTWSQLG